MSIYDARARMEQMEREHDEYVERMRVKHRGDLYPVLMLLAFGIFCMCLGFILGRSI
ncbi:hypothetical protein HU727_020150 [Pseudomonas sp. SWRI153]|uniref:Uncharacterized protein n=1 Tax=Pseudomonas khorasanensis TaxID=2745508 RepID=A0A923F681_9PSED|nr:hypothetical protein [Pseudomonas khorasanensis]MBV4487902.1 hypothetical protein [Pseudomonas khorasanensis]